MTSLSYAFFYRHRFINWDRSISWVLALPDVSLYFPRLFAGGYINSIIDTQIAINNKNSDKSKKAGYSQI